MLLDLDQAQRGVVEHDHDHPQPEPDRGLDFHQRHAEPAVPGERDDRHPRGAQGRANGGRQRVTHGGQATRDE